jgi:hypothetical protein
LQPTPDGGRQGKAEIAIIAYDQAGRALNWIERAYQLRMNADQFAEVERRGLKFHLDIDIPKEGISLRSGVYDLSIPSRRHPGSPHALRHHSPEELAASASK